MAGDWIKIEHAMPDKPEVFRIAMDLGITPEQVSGCLLRVWIWADIQTLDGNGVCVTGVTLDRIACYEGLAQAMKKVGWLVGEESNFSFPNFNRHNGETAKTRALTTKRVAKHRNAKSVTPALPREEKRRVNNISTIQSLFVEFWDAYGKKVGKPNALKEWNKISPSDDEAKEIISAANSLRLSRPDPTYRKDPERWLKARGWEDELTTVQSVKSDSLTEIFARAI